MHRAEEPKLRQRGASHDKPITTKQNVTIQSPVMSPTDVNRNQSTGNEKQRQHTLA
jgi:hypothetical protein